MTGYKDYFKGKKVTILGLGLLGKRLGDAIFLAECGAEVTVTDLKSARDLVPSVKALKKYKNVRLVLGEHRFEDFENKDFILKGQGAPLDSVYIAHARKNKIPIEMDESLFMKLAHGVKLIGITGTRGKTTVTELIYHILKKAKKPVYLGGNIKGTAALPLLKKVKKGDIVVFELSSWQLQGFGESKISPSISVFTNFMPDHMNYYKNDLKAYFKDKAQIFLHHKKGDALIVSPSLVPLVDSKVQSEIVVAKASDVSRTWKLKIPGEHNRQNIACVIQAVKAIGVKDDVIKKAVESFKGVAGRLEFVRAYKGIKIYNDTCATTPEAAIVGMKSVAPLSADGRVVLLAGGTEKALDPKPFGDAIPEYTKSVVLLAGTGTEKLKTTLHERYIAFTEVKDLKTGVKEALKFAKKGDVILFSPGFASFGMFKNEYDRGEQFVKIVKGLK